MQNVQTFPRPRVDQLGLQLLLGLLLDLEVLRGETRKVPGKLLTMVLEWWPLAALYCLIVAWPTNHHAQEQTEQEGGRVRYHQAGCLDAGSPHLVPHRLHQMSKTSSAPSC